MLEDGDYKVIDGKLYKLVEDLKDQPERIQPVVVPVYPQQDWWTQRPWWLDPVTTCETITVTDTSADVHT